MTQKTFAGELVGRKIKIVKSTNKNDLRITGTVVDETKNTLKVKQGKMTKTVMKKNVTFLLNGEAVITGRTIVKRPEERIKG